jgi:hypothetical protein
MTLSLLPSIPIPRHTLPCRPILQPVYGGIRIHNVLFLLEEGTYPEVQVGHKRHFAVVNPFRTDDDANLAGYLETIRGQSAPIRVSFGIGQLLYADNSTKDRK